MALFKNTEDFKAHAPEIHKNYSWDSLSKKVDQITLLRVIPFVSQAEYDRLETAYLTDATSAEDDALLISLQPSIAYYVYLHLLSTNRIQLSNMGVQEASSDDGTSTPASYHAIADVKEEIADLAYSFMEQALAYMETEKAYFTDWAGSDSYTEIKSCFVWNTAIFNKHVNAGGSRHTFLAVRSQLIGVQEDVVYSQLGEAFYEDLLAKLKANTLSAAETKAVEKIQACNPLQAY